MFNEDIFKNADEIIKIRRHLHQNPELSGKEYNTAEYIREKLAEYGIEYSESAKTGTIAIIRGEKSGKTVLLRADIDALPITEKTSIDFKSNNEGVMHACGHDIHTACLLYAGKVLNDMKNELSGNVKLMFQPREETDGGALEMINEGALENPAVDGAFALHVEPLEKCGFLQIKDGAVMASPDDFEIKIIGKGGHGATPHECINPITIGSKIVEEYNSVSGKYINAQLPCVVSVCRFEGGTCPNVIPDSVLITGTARTLETDTREKVMFVLEDIAKKVCQAYGAICEFKFNKSYPPTISDSKMNRIVADAAKKIPQIEGVTILEHSSMCGEDFAYVAEKVPSAYFKLGVGNEKINAPIHSPEFMADEKALPIGAAILVQNAVDFLDS